MQKSTRTERWEELYRDTDVEDMPWFNPRLDHDVAGALGNLGFVNGSILDIGAGPGTQAIELARRGFEVTATDISETAVKKAAIRAKESGVDVNFLQDDIINTGLTGSFDIAIDRGCFHIIEPVERTQYVQAVHRLIKPQGYLLLKCFSHHEPPGPGPYRIHPGEIFEAFDEKFEIIAIKESVFQGVRRPAPRGLFCEMQKRPQNNS